MNELVTNALQVSCQFRICNIGGVDRRGVEFIGKNTLIRSQIYSKLYILVLYQAVNPLILASNSTGHTLLYNVTSANQQSTARCS